MLILLNTYNYNHIILDENQNSIVTLIKYKKINIVLPGDMTNEYKITSHFGEINILKFPHHGVGDICFQNLIELKPAYIIISSDFIYQRTFKLMEYMKKKYKSKIYLLKDIKQTAIKLYLKSNNVQIYYFDKKDITKIKLNNKLTILIFSILLLSIFTKYLLLKLNINKKKIYFSFVLSSYI